MTVSPTFPLSRFCQRRIAAGGSLVVEYVCPAQEKLAFLGIALYGLGSCNNRHPVVDVLACGVALEAIELDILLSQILLTVQHKEQICSGRSHTEA